MADQTVAIENFEELAKFGHKCTATETLTDIQVKIGRLDENVKLMATSNQELNREMRQFMAAGHICKQAEQIAKNTKAIELLEKERNKKIGSDYWVEKFVESIKYIFLFILGMFITFILTGGHLT